MPPIDPRRSIEIELQWLVSVYSPKILDEIRSLLITAIEACGVEHNCSNQHQLNASVESVRTSRSSKLLFPTSALTLRGSDKNVTCYINAAGDRIIKASLRLSVPDWNRSNEVVIESDRSATIVMTQLFNAGNIVSLALEHLNNSHVPESGTDDCFVRSTFVSKLNDIKRLLARGIQQLIDVDQQSIFPYTVFDPNIYIDAPDDLVLEYFIQSGKLCANVYLITPTSHQSPSHSRQKSTVSHPSVTISSLNQISSSYYFYNGSPVEIIYHTRLEALLPSAITTLTSIENALGLLDDLCQKIDCIQKLLDSY